MSPQQVDEEQAPPRSQDEPLEEGLTTDENDEAEIELSSSQPQQQDHDYDDDVTVMTVDTDAPNDVRPPPAIHHQEKQGGKFCGYCCDYRRAVIIIGTVTVFMGLLDLIFRIGNAVEAYQPPFDDDALVDELIRLNDMYRIAYILLEAMAVVFGSVSIMGAMNFSQLGVSRRMN